MASAVKQRRIAVVGAGIAGLSAARRLTRAGVEVAVFDKARRPGGRISTRRAGSFSFDHGAQYFTCRNAAFEELVRRWRARGLAARWNSPVVTLEQGVRKKQRGTTRRYVGVPGMSALARDLSADLRVESGRRIERLERGAAGWRVICEDESTFIGFDGVVVAAPAPQTAALLAPLPAMAQRVAAVPMQACHALMITFSEPLGIDFGGAFVRASPLGWVARNASKPGRGMGECWVLQTTPEWSAAHPEEIPEGMVTTLLSAFAEALGRELPSTLFRATHRWRFARSQEALGTPFLWDSEARVGVCGDWCLGGRIEDAFLSGDGLSGALLGEFSLAVAADGKSMEQQDDAA